MSDQCQICGPHKSEAPVIICAPCALTDLGRAKEAALSAELLYLRIMREELERFVGGPWMRQTPWPTGHHVYVLGHLDRILAIGKSATGPAVATPSEIKTIGSKFCPACTACPENA